MTSLHTHSGNSRAFVEKAASFAAGIKLKLAFSVGCSDLLAERRRYRDIQASGYWENEVYHSIRELVIGMLSNAHKLVHLGMGYMVRRSTLSDANGRRKGAVFGDIYMSVYAKHCESLSDSRLSKPDIKRLYAMDSTTITLSI